MKINIMTATLTTADAIGNWTRTLHRLFSLKGLNVQLYADLFDGSIKCLPSSEYISTGKDVFWYHYSIYANNLELVKKIKDLKIMDFHGVSPSYLFKGYNEELEKLCQLGEEELPRIAPLFDYHVVHSGYTAGILRDLGISKTIINIPLVTDNYLFRSESNTRYVKNLENINYILFVGRIVPQKCILEIIETFNHLRKLRPGTRLFLVGGYNYSQAYLEQVLSLIKKHDLEKEVILTGKISNLELLHSFYRNAKFTIILSRWESFCVPIVESMCFGTPVIGIDVGPIGEIMGEGGILASNRDAKEVAGIINQNWDGVKYSRLKKKASTRGKQFSDAKVDEIIQSKIFPLIKATPRKPKLAFVIHRYGEDITGGAEILCRHVAERLKSFFQIEIITTCARDYNTWENYYSAGKAGEKGVIVRRFPVDSCRDISGFRTFSKKVFDLLPNYIEQVQWMKRQGPRSTDMIDYIYGNKGKYDLFVFFTYLYYSTYFGIQLVRNRSVLVPLAHNEPPFYLDLFSHLFRIPSGIIYCTESEKKFVERVIPFSQENSAVAGVGIDVSTENLDFQAVKHKYQLPDKYMVYCGRISKSKGCDILFEYILQYLEQKDTPMKLIILGEGDYPIPSHPGLKALGYIPELEKKTIIKNSLAVINPSYFESLSMIVLESWALSTPVIVNRYCEVLEEHCKASQGGLSFKDYASFAKCCDVILSNPTQKEKLGNNGFNYVNQNYRWEKILRKYTDFFINLL